MNLILGTIVVFGSVIAGYVLSHGNLAALWQPYELIIICGAAFGAFIIANPMSVIKKTFSGSMSLIGGSKYNKQIYMDLLTLMFGIFQKARKEGLMAIEDDIEDPDSSALFNEYPKVIKDHHIRDFITDYLRIIVGGNMNPFELEGLMDLELDNHHHEAAAVPTAITRVSDGLPGFGIVAAVLGIVITMGSLGGPAEEIGAHVGAALVGTLLGILFAYGTVGPMANQLEARNADEAGFYQVLKVCLMANVNGYSPQICVEFGRKAMPSGLRPSFSDMETHLKDHK
ncbi:MAG: flagellar motor stator protein MotA [Gammaproteobacteria bacterium]|nr:flagellar motor stator protein MotA [Gammaproteobacteria bacterium]